MPKNSSIIREPSQEFLLKAINNLPMPPKSRLISLCNKTVESDSSLTLGFDKSSKKPIISQINFPFEDFMKKEPIRDINFYFNSKEGFESFKKYLPLLSEQKYTLEYLFLRVPSQIDRNYETQIILNDSDTSKNFQIIFSELVEDAKRLKEWFSSLGY